jgi:hypothetical protein
MFQPVQGFGIVGVPSRVRQRLGWATSRNSVPGALQIDTLGNRFVRGAGNEVYQLTNGWPISGS